MKTVFTLCSNNYLAQAKVLGDSLIDKNHDMKFVIGIVDKPHPEINYSDFSPHQILFYSDLKNPNFEEMERKYNIIEFNTAVKPFYFAYLFANNPDCSIIYYIDPDIVIYSNLDEANNLLGVYNFLLTPHIISPQKEVSPFETIFLNVGVFNLGFIGISRSLNSTLFLEWWMERLKNYCYINANQGLFVDQIWINFMTFLFDGTYVIKSPGYNMACWNFHERKLLKIDNKYYVNAPETPLVFFHFSAFDPSDPVYLNKLMKIPALTFDSRPDASELFEDYKERLLKNGYNRFSKLKPLLQLRMKKNAPRHLIGRFLRNRGNILLQKIFDI